jgi:hypothetical protein
MSNLVELKPCYHGIPDYAYVTRCDKNKWKAGCDHEDCPKRDVYGKTKQEAVEKWNRRTP